MRLVGDGATRILVVYYSPREQRSRCGFGAAGASSVFIAAKHLSTFYFIESVCLATHQPVGSASVLGSLELSSFQSLFFSGRAKSITFEQFFWVASLMALLAVAFALWWFGADAEKLKPSPWFLPFGAGSIISLPATGRLQGLIPGVDPSANHTAKYLLRPWLQTFSIVSCIGRFRLLLGMRLSNTNKFCHPSRTRGNVTI
jgi:hypothetical protein